MFIITNRNIEKEASSGFDIVGNRPNALGPAELRVLEARRIRGKWSLSLLPDEITDAMKAEIQHPSAGPVYASEYLFQRLVAAVNPRQLDPDTAKQSRDLILFVHGFNNTLEDVVERCHGLSEEFDVETVAFTWPANGGGIRGVADYLDDKRDALASVVAFDRVLAKSHEFITRLRQEALHKLIDEARERFPDSGERQRDFVAKMAEKHCPVRITLLLHSMGNYLLERTLKSTALRGQLALFDNVVLCAADVNNPRHAEWVDQVQVRNRLYVTINEDDSALRASRLKGGDEQLARLGHWTTGLDSRQAVYIDFTGERNVGSAHAYFEGDPLKNPKVRKFFQHALHGLRAEDAVSLAYDAAHNLHRFA